MQYSGMIATLLIIIFSYIVRLWEGLTEIQIGLLLYFLTLPTILTAFFIKNRKIKDIARFLLGGSFLIAFVLLIFTLDWLIKIWIVLNFILGYMCLNRRRIQKNAEICSMCKENVDFPYCSGYQTYKERENIFMTQVLYGRIHDPFSLPPDQLEE